MRQEASTSKPITRSLQAKSPSGCLASLRGAGLSSDPSHTTVPEHQWTDKRVKGVLCRENWQKLQCAAATVTPIEH